MQPCSHFGGCCCASDLPLNETSWNPLCPNHPYRLIRKRCSRTPFIESSFIVNHEKKMPALPGTPQRLKSHPEAQCGEPGNNKSHSFVSAELFCTPHDYVKDIQTKQRTTRLSQATAAQFSKMDLKQDLNISNNA